MWAVVNRFGHDELYDELNGSKIHRLEDVMMVPDPHSLFNQLKVWFVPTVRHESWYDL